MKRTSFRLDSFGLNFVFLIILLGAASSCSWLSSRDTLFDEEEQKTQKASNNQMVPKAQYDELLRKYEVLAKERQQSLTQEQMAEPSEIINQLNEVKPQAELAETVDVFGKGGVVQGQEKAEGAPVSSFNYVNYDDVNVEGELQKLSQARNLLAQNKLDQSLSLLKQLETSKVRQVSVRAKFYIGETLFVQKEYDLAMQIFEEIIQKDAFSGIVLKALGRLIVCSEKLNLKKKKEQYYSILHDFFEA